jgi:DNA-binding CsgD family transcriptional regulator
LFGAISMDKLNQPFCSKHPLAAQAESFKAIAAPLQKFNIDYFAHVRIDKKKQFTAVANDPQFAEIYFKKKYYNADIHMAQEVHWGDFIIWDAIELDKKSLEMKSDFSELGYHHDFTLVEHNHYYTDYYHFATKTYSMWMNQVYLSNMDLLRVFIQEFKKKMSGSKELSLAYDYKYTLIENESSIKNQILLSEYSRELFLKKLKGKNKMIINPNDDHSPQQIFIHKDSNEPVELSLQQAKCLKLVFLGYTAKVIGEALALSPRTVESYLIRIRQLLNCDNMKELILYYS